MKYHATTAEKANGTYLQGYVKTTYDHIVSVLGEPTRTYSNVWNKVTCEWVIEFEDGKIGTIYDWKMEATPLNEYEWHIGGHSEVVVERIQNLLNSPVLAD